MNSKIKLMAWVITLLTLVPPAGMTERDAIPKSVMKSIKLLVAYVLYSVTLPYKLMISFKVRRLTFIIKLSKCNKLIDLITTYCTFYSFVNYTNAIYF